MYIYIYIYIYCVVSKKNSKCTRSAQANALCTRCLVHLLVQRFCLPCALPCALALCTFLVHFPLLRKFQNSGDCLKVLVRALVQSLCTPCARLERSLGRSETLSDPCALPLCAEELQFNCAQGNYLVHFYLVPACARLVRNLFRWIFY